MHIKIYNSVNVSMNLYYIYIFFHSNLNQYTSGAFINMYANCKLLVIIGLYIISKQTYSLNSVKLGKRHLQ